MSVEIGSSIRWIGWNESGTGMKDAIGHAGNAMLLPHERFRAVLFRQHAATRASRERIREHAINGLLQHDGDVTLSAGLKTKSTAFAISSTISTQTSFIRMPS